MAKCLLGPKKTRQLEVLTGRSIEAAYTRGGWPHNHVEVFFKGETYTTDNWPPIIDRNTGAVVEGAGFSLLKRVMPLIEEAHRETQT